MQHTYVHVVGIRRERGRERRGARVKGGGMERER